MLTRQPRRRALPAGVTGTVERQDEVGDPEKGLPNVLRELMAHNDDRIKKYQAAGQDVGYWRGYQIALADLWRCFEHLYEEF